MIVRQARTADSAALSTLARQTCRDAFGNTFSATDLALLLEETRSEDSFRKAMKTSTVLVAEIENAIVGYVQISDVTLYVESSTGISS